ncbi:MAG: hypothetical protein IJ161_13080 [Bacteroidales bacterium]|nr:hypothetical protein [Bacteroidales bacterium]
MIAAFIIALVVALVFIGFFFDERNASKDYNRSVEQSLSGIRASISLLDDHLASLSSDSKTEPGDKNSSPEQVEKGGVSVGKESEYLSPLTREKVLAAIRFNGFVPEVEDDMASFRYEGEVFVVHMESLPLIFLSKDYSIDPESDLEVYRKAASETSQNAALVDVIVRDNNVLSFIVGGLEKVYGGLRDNLVDYIRIIRNGQAIFNDEWNRITEEKAKAEEKDKAPEIAFPPSKGSGKTIVS